MNQFYDKKIKLVELVSKKVYILGSLSNRNISVGLDADIFLYSIFFFYNFDVQSI